MKLTASVAELEPPRLLGSGTAHERRLLQSAERDLVPHGARARLEAALSPLLADVAPARPAAVEAGGSPPAPQPRAETAALTRSALGVRGGVVGLIGAGIVAGIVAALALSSSEPAPASVPAPELAPALAPVGADPLAASPAPPPAVEEPAPPSGAPSAEGNSRELTEGAAAPSSSAPQRRRPSPSVKLERRATLLEEVRQLDAVRSALQGGALADARRGLQSYAARFPQGELRLEHALLRLELLLAGGERAAAQQLARELLTWPGSERHARRLRVLASEQPDQRSEAGGAHIRERR
jgi:hypothetical protein